MGVEVGVGMDVEIDTGVGVSLAAGRDVKVDSGPAQATPIITNATSRPDRLERPMILTLLASELGHLDAR